MKAKVLMHLPNGGSKVAGVDGLQAEIDTIQQAMNAHRRELGAMPARREELLLADDADEALDKLEMRERELYRKLEKGALQIVAIEARLVEMRDAAIQPKIDRHRSALMAASEKVEAAVLAAIAANEAAFTAFEDAASELGRDNANRLMPQVHFASFLNNEGLELWRSQLNDQRQRIDRQQGRTQ